MKDLQAMQQVESRAALTQHYQQEMLGDIRKRVGEAGRPLSESELSKLRREYDKKIADALQKQTRPAVTGRPNADGQSWFYYLVNKPRSAFDSRFLVEEARYDAKRVDLLYIGADGYPLLADSAGMAPSAEWGGRYNEWRVKNGLAADARFAETEKAARAAMDEERRLEFEAAIVKANSAEGGHEHGHDAQGHEGHGHDPITEAWHHKHHDAHVKVFGGSMVAFLIGLALSMFFFSPWGPFYRREWVGHVGFLAATRAALKKGYFMDDLYYGTVVRAQGWLMRLCSWFDKVIVDGLVNLAGKVTVWLGFVVAKADYWGVDGTVRGVSNATSWAGATASKAPTGKISDYVFMLIGALVLLFLLLALMS